MKECYERGNFTFKAGEDDGIRTLRTIEKEMLQQEEEEILKLKRNITYCDGMKYLRSQKTIDKITYDLGRTSKRLVTSGRDGNICSINVCIEIWVNSDYRYKRIEIEYSRDRLIVKTDYEPYKVYCKKIIESLKD